uniref:Phosphoglycerate mutase family protein n=1 Tax=Panagrellus redivivus TaxID=6233 RepID=A0A7E4V1V7_PANRE
MASDSTRFSLIPLSPDVKGEKPVRRRIYLVRNAESCDRLCQAWRHKAFRDHGIYRLVDLNQPVKIYDRPADAFKNDSPVTQVGSLSAQLVGRGMCMRSCGVHTVYSSPALRCVQSAASVVSTLNMKRGPRICVEPGLVNPLLFYWQDRLPSFLSTNQFTECGYPIETEYEPRYSVQQMSEKLFQEKSIPEMYTRLAKVAEVITEASKERVDGGVLVVTHAPIIDVLVRIITEKVDRPRTVEDLYRMGLNYPFSSVTTLEVDAKTGKWVYLPDAIPGLSYMHVSTHVEIPQFSD